MSLTSCPGPSAHRRRLLFESLGVSVSEFRCRASAGDRGEEEPNPAHSIVFVRRGVFRREHRGEAVLADANHILFFHAGEPYRYAHPIAGGDDCTILTLAPAVAIDAALRAHPAAERRPEAPFAGGHAFNERRAARLHYEMLHRLAVGSSPGLAVEDVLSELIDAAVSALPGRREGGRAGEPKRGRHRDMVEATKLVLNERFDAPPRLAALARQFDCSPFHLSRTFRAVAGLSLRRYLGILRSRLAADRLARGAADLTGLALDLGFADHSHFTNAFRREWGVPPSRLRTPVQEAAAGGGRARSRPARRRTT